MHQKKITYSQTIKFLAPKTYTSSKKKNGNSEKLSLLPLKIMLIS